MENNLMLSDDLLWDYADGFLTAEEKARVEAALANHPEWCERLEAVQAEKRAFHALPLEKPKPGFSDRVMAAWATESHSAYVATAKGKDWVVYLVSTVLGLFICVAFVVAGMQAGPKTLPSGLEVPKVPELQWEQVVGNVAVRYGAYLMLAVLMLKLVERYLQQRRALDRLKA